jgi:putative ABC transport system permease protein
MTPTPPRWCTALLTSLLPPGTADEIVGDLHEEFTAIARLRGPRQARLWYGGQCLRLSVRATGRRAVALVGRAPAEPHGTVKGDPLMRSLLTDARQAARGLVKRPALTAIVIMTLGLGLGANAAIFQVIDALILRPFTLRDADRLTLVAETAPDLRLDTQETVSPANYLDWKAQTAGTFEQLAAFEWWDVNMAAETDAERVAGFFVTANFFDALGVQPAIGRSFVADEETRGNHRRVILSHDLWQRRFAGDRSVVGTSVLLDGEPYEIVGIAPEGFAFPMGTALWAPLAFDAKTAARRDARYLTVVGRLAEGRTLDDAKAQMAVVGERLASQYPDVNKGRGARAMSLVRGMRDQGLGPMVVLWQASAAFVLLIACANIANLLLARSAERTREIAVRSALGATRARIVRGMLVESAVLALAAVPVALGVAWVGVTLIRVNLPARLIRFVEGWQTMDVDGRLIAFTAVLALATSALFGILPALRASRPALSETLKEGGRASSAGRQRQRVRTALVVAEIALALPLLVASGLCAIGANRFLNGDQGYDPEGLLVMRAVLPEAKYGAADARRLFAARLEARLSELPGVEAVGVSNVLPATGNNFNRPIEIDGRPVADRANMPRVDFRAVRPQFLATMRIPMLRGRGFTAADTVDAQPVAIVNQAAADRHFPGTDPIGQRIKVGAGEWATVVGVAGNTIHDWFVGRNNPTVYAPFDQAPTGYLAIGMRANGDLHALVQPVRAAVREIDPAQPIFDVMTMRTLLGERTIGLQYVAAIMAVFGGIALVLAVVGVYSLMAFVIGQRTHEIGVRIALGASRRDVLRLTIGQATTMTAIGVAIGLALSLGLGRLMESALFGFVSSDARVAIGFAAVLIAAAILAGYVPARRASGIDPIVALRE